MAASKKGPGRSSQQGRSQGRVTKPVRHEGADTGRYISAEDSGRYTAPTPAAVYQSPRWYGPMILVMFLVGLVIIILNYTEAFGTANAWMLLAGLVIIVAGFISLLRYR